MYVGKSCVFYEKKTHLSTWCLVVLCAAAASVDKQSGWVAFAVLVVTLMPLDMKGLSFCRFKVGLDALLDCWPDPKPWASVVFSVQFTGMRACWKIGVRIKTGCSAYFG